MKVAIYPGSFNPLHIGHRAILEHLTKEAGFHAVYMIVTPQNPHKGAVDNAEARFKAAVEAVGRYPSLNVKVDDIELHMPPPQYTIRTLDALREREPGNGFTLIIGADNLESMPRWKEHSRILLEYGVAVFPRKGYHRGRLKAALLRENPSYRIELLKMPNVNISSTRIREGMSKGEDMSKWLM